MIRQLLLVLVMVSFCCATNDNPSALEHDKVSVISDDFGPYEEIWTDESTFLCQILEFYAPLLNIGNGQLLLAYFVSIKLFRFTNNIYGRALPTSRILFILFMIIHESIFALLIILKLSETHRDNSNLILPSFLLEHADSLALFLEELPADVVKSFIACFLCFLTVTYFMYAFTLHLLKNRVTNNDVNVELSHYNKDVQFLD